jgi:UDP-N-acetylmuramoyl-tripeptide--D-alanyl-D-alanine ligase
MISLTHLKACPSVVNLPKNLNYEDNLGFCSDSRKYTHPAFFVAIPGLKVNPLDVIGKLLDMKCPLVVYEVNQDNTAKVEKLQANYPNTTFLAVTNSITFLQEISHLHIVEWKNATTNHAVFAISGSNGKTTHKEMLGHILSNINPNKIVITEKNNNNHLGVPLTLLQVSKNTELVVLELGSNHPGEIKVLCDIAVPNAGLTTNIGATHLEFFGTEEKVFDEEGYLYHAVKNETKGDGFYLINNDDPYLKNLKPFNGCVTFAEKEDAQAKITYLDDGAQLFYKSKTLRVSNKNVTGQHNKLNLITCAFIAHHFFPDKQREIILAASSFKPTKNRSEWIEFDGVPVYLDAYNANPSSMKAALEGFKQSVLEKKLSLNEACIVLGDMNELGDLTAQYHLEVARFTKNLGFTNVYFVGRYSSQYAQGFSEGESRASTSEFKNEYRNNLLKKYRIHFIKGSRSLQLESLFDIT